MDKSVQMFQFQQHAVRVVKDEQGEPWFVAKDVAEILSLGNSNSSVALLDDDEKGIHSVETLGGNQEMTVINESGLYSLILRSRKPEAKKFKKWITSEVLPSIRKHGGYLTPEKVEEALLNPDTIIRLATELKEERVKRLALASKVQADAPKVLFADSVSASSTSILVGELAKILKQNGIEIGQNRLFERLRQDGFLMKDGSSRNMPTQRSMDMGLFTIKETVINKPDGSVLVSKTVKVTGRGQVYFIDYFLGRKSA